MAARDSNVHLVCRFHDRGARRNEPAAVRSTGGRTGARRRLSHRIRVDETRIIFSLRIHRHDHRRLLPTLMAITVPRPNLNWRERMFLPAIAAGLAITIKHFKNMIFRRTKVTMQYPEEKWDSNLPDYYRGAPALVRDTDGRVRCVACQLCEFICPPRAIKIIPGEIPSTDRFAKVEKYPEAFDIDMIRCIFCGMCEEVCPEQAIFLRKEYAITGFTRADMVHHKEKLLEIGGVMHGVVLKWNEKK